MPTTQEILVCLQSIQQKTIKLEILNLNENVVDEISGLCIDGSLSIDGQSAIRRTCNLKFILNSKTMISENSSLWINKRFKLWLGIIDILTGNEIPFLCGTFLINNPSTDIQVSEQTVSIKGMDKMCRMDNTLSGQIGSKVEIASGTPISDAITATITTLGGETNYLVDTSPYTVPSDIEEDFAVTVYDICKKLADFYLTWKIYYDRNSIFRFSEIKDGINDSISFDFSNYSVIQSISQENNYDNVRNYFKIIGKLNDSGIQYYKEVFITSTLYPNSPFTIEKMGESKTRNFVLQDDNLYTQAQVDSRCEYEIYKHLTLAESISITCIPLLFLCVDEIIYIDESDYGITGKYLIDSIDLSLDYKGMMTIKAHKIYEGD